MLLIHSFYLILKTKIMKVKRSAKTFIAMLMLVLTSSDYLPAQTGDNHCQHDVVVQHQENGQVTLCSDEIFQPGTQNNLPPWYSSNFNISCTSGDGAFVHTGGVYTHCFTIPCCSSEDGLVLTWTPSRAQSEVPCVLQIQASCCDGPDSDGDGICDEVECNPNDSSQNHSPGDPCDDGDPNTEADMYNDNCECVGITGDPSFCYDFYQPGDLCSDGNPLTIGDRYNDSCECVGEPIPCGDVVVDDGCPLTIDIIDDNCVVTHLPPDVDDGCPLTYDYFDAENCVVVHEDPEVDDGCTGTKDSFDAYNCEIINESIICDDGNTRTVGDKYDDGCNCTGCDPCELQGRKWELLCELLNR